jgi:hypothetical protein
MRRCQTHHRESHWLETIARQLTANRLLTLQGRPYSQSSEMAARDLQEHRAPAPDFRSGRRFEELFEKNDWKIHGEMVSTVDRRSKYRMQAGMWE